MHHNPARRLTFGLLVSIAASAGLHAQTGSDPVPAASPEGKFSRWLSFDQFTYNSSYQGSFDTYGRRVFDTSQQQMIADGKVKFDKKGRYFAGFRISAGSGFNWSYSRFAKQDIQSILPLDNPKMSQLLTTFQADPIRNIFLSGRSGSSTTFRNLYLSATPVDGLTFEYGAMPMERGDGSSITNFDDQQNILGGRIRLRAPRILWLDSLSAALAYSGDPITPSLFNRIDRFEQTNYWQVVAEKHLGKHLQASVDYTTLQHTHTVREAAEVNLAEWKFLDSSRFELYQRTNAVMMPAYVAPAAHGWSISATKVLRKRYTLGAGFADIDPDYGVYTGSSFLTVSGFPVNGSAYQIGKRFFVESSLKVTTYLRLAAFYTHEISPERSPLYFDFNRQGLNAGITLDLGNVLSEKLRWF